jgi:hypothetical protein
MAKHPIFLIDRCWWLVVVVLLLLLLLLFPISSRVSCPQFLLEECVKIRQNMDSKASLSSLAGKNGVQASNKDELPPYTLGDHCRYLGLKMKRSYYYCDWTRHFVQESRAHGPASKLEDVVLDYCRPFASPVELSDMFEGLEGLSNNNKKKEPLAFRTLTMRIRPDASNETVMTSLVDAWNALNPGSNNLVLKRSGELFQAISSNGHVSYVVHIQLCTAKTAVLERLLLLQFYHQTDVMLMEEELQLVGGLESQQTPAPTCLVNTQLKEACGLVNCLLQLKQSSSTGGDKDTTPAPAPTQQECSQHFLWQHLESWSVKEENQRSASHKHNDNKQRRVIFPALSKQDLPYIQESYALIFRVWSELEQNKCTFNTLCDETCSRFGMRPCQPTLDKQYCAQLSRISHDRMIHELRSSLTDAQLRARDIAASHGDVQQLLDCAIQHYQLLPPGTPAVSAKKKDSELAIELPNHPEFPWHKKVSDALRQVSRRVADDSLNMNRDSMARSLSFASESVQKVFQAFGEADDLDQKEYLRRVNRQAMEDLSKQQAQLRNWVRVVRDAKTPPATASAARWNALALQASNQYGRPTNSLQAQVPLLHFETFTGQGCVTCSQLIVTSKIAFMQSSSVFDLETVDVRASNNTLTKMSVWLDGKKLYGLNPSVGADRLVKFIQVLKSIQVV